MKKVLFASTALVAFAGAAAADVAVSGYAELGIADSGAAGENLGFFSSVDVRFSMTGETDSGLSFGATIDLDDALETAGKGEIGDNTDNTSNDYTIFVSGAFGTVTFGDTDGAMDWALTEGGNIGNPGSLNDAETSHAGYAGSYLDGKGDGMIMRYNNTFGGVSMAVSVEQGNLDADAGVAIGVKGSMAGFAYGVGYQDGVDGSELMGLSLGYSMDAFSAGIMYATGEDAAGADLEYTQVGVGYSAGALSLHANYGETVSTDGWGVAAKYDLGGAGVHFGINSDDKMSLGLAMSF